MLQSEDTLKWLEPVVIGVAAAAAIALLLMSHPRLRLLALGAVLAALSIAPAAWAVDTLGHATSSTFPAGGPANAGGGFGGSRRIRWPCGLFGRGGGPRVVAVPAAVPRRRSGRSPACSAAQAPTAAAGPVPAVAAASVVGSGGGGNFGRRRLRWRRFGGGRCFGGGFGGAFGGGQSLSSALSYIKAHGGGTLAVSSQTTAETAIIDGGAHVAGIGGFSGNESEVTAGWLAQEIQLREDPLGPR